MKPREVDAAAGGTVEGLWGSELLPWPLGGYIALGNVSSAQSSNIKRRAKKILQLNTTLKQILVRYHLIQNAMF